MVTSQAVARAAKQIQVIYVANLQVSLRPVGSVATESQNQANNAITKINLAAQSGAKQMQGSVAEDLLSQPVSETTQLAETESRKWHSPAMMATKSLEMVADPLV